MSKRRLIPMRIRLQIPMRVRLLILLLVALPMMAEQRDGYRIDEVQVPVSHGKMVRGYLLVPDSVPEFGCPAVVACHDHGARFTIGKEKVCRPMVSRDSTAEELAVLRESEAWVKKYYGGAYVADTLARHGFVVLVTDALYWGERVPGKVNHTLSSEELKEINKSLKMAQVAFYVRCMALYDEPWFDVILADDRACVSYLMTRPEVDANAIGVWGFSMGAYRAWQLAADDWRVAWCAAANWMTTAAERGKDVKEGQSWQLPDVSGWSMYRPTKEDVDYGEIVSSIAPRPMLLQYGREDHLFPYGEHGIRPWDALQIEVLEGEHRFTAAHLSGLLVWLRERIAR